MEEYKYNVCTADGVNLLMHNHTGSMQLVTFVTVQLGAVRIFCCKLNSMHQQRRKKKKKMSPGNRRINVSPL